MRNDVIGELESPNKEVREGGKNFNDLQLMRQTA